jgi:hypothetical protein
MSKQKVMKTGFNVYEKHNALMLIKGFGHTKETVEEIMTG